MKILFTFSDKLFSLITSIFSVEHIDIWSSIWVSAPLGCLRRISRMFFSWGWSCWVVSWDISPNLLRETLFVNQKRKRMLRASLSHHSPHSFLNLKAISYSKHYNASFHLCQWRSITSTPSDITIDIQPQGIYIVD